MITIHLKELIARWGTQRRKRLTYQGLADASGVGVATVARWANGEVSMEVLEALCAFFDCQPADLLSYRPEVPIAQSDVDRAIAEARERGLEIADLVEAPAR